jgi:hypothetical protein
MQQRGVAAHDVSGHSFADGTIQRDDKAQSSKASQNQHYVIGDKGLDVGGGNFVAKLEDLKTELMKTSPPGGRGRCRSRCTGPKSSSPRPAATR